MNNIINELSHNNTINETKGEVKMICTNEEMIAALKEADIPVSVCEAIAEIYTVSDIRAIVNAEDVATLKANLKNVGEKRAHAIIDTLKGRIPEPMSRPVPDLKAPDVEMYSIPEFDLVYDTATQTAKLKLNREGRNKKRFGPALQMLQKVSGIKNPVVFTTVSEIQPDRNDTAKEYIAQRFWDNAVHNGIVIKGVKYMPLIMGTNAKMRCQIHWAEAQYVESVRNWVNCGANLQSNQNIAKIEAYYGLCLPFTHTLLNGVLTPDMEVIIPSWENDHEGENLLINPDGSMNHQDTYNVNEFDGMCFIELTDKLIDKMKLSRQQKRQLIRSINTFNGGTLRGPWHKGIIVWGFHIHDYLRSIGVNTVNGKNIDDIAIFGDKTMLKAALGEGGLYEKLEDFAVEFKARQHRFGVLLENHGIKNTFLPAQQLQAAHGAKKEFIEEGASEEVAYLNASADALTAALRYEPRLIARISQKDPSIMSTWFATELANNGYRKEYEAALSGRTHGNSVSGFCIKDVFAYCQWIAYNEGVRTELPTGILNAYEVYAQTAGFTGKAVASRNPVIANYGLHVVDVIEKLPDEYEQYVDQGFDYIMVGIHDDLCKLLRMDHDGDKARLTFAPWFVKAVDSIEKDGAFAEWESFGPVKKTVPTYGNSLDFFGTCTATPTLGLNVDTCGKMISNGVASKPIHDMIMDYLMNKGTDVKQGADGSNVAGEAGKIWAEMQRANKESKYSIAQAYGKGLKGREVKTDKVATEYGDSNLDIISKAVAENAVKELHFDGEFAVEKVLIDRPMAIRGLCGSGIWNEATGEYVNQGLFNILAGRNAKDWNEIDESIQKNSWQEFKAWKKAQALAELNAFAATVHKKDANGNETAETYTPDDVYDALTTYVFCTLRKSWFKQNTTKEKRNWLVILARTYLEWFGDKLEATFCKNEKIDALKAVAEGVDLTDEVEGE